MELLSTHYGEFIQGAWIPFPRNQRKYAGVGLQKTHGRFEICPFCGNPVGGKRETSTINVCISCGTPLIVTKFIQVKKAEKEVNQ
jgi:ribosomal protein L37AE/L43A